MQQFDVFKQQEWLIERGFTLEDVSEDNIRVYMRSLGCMTFISEYKRGCFTYAVHVSWDGDTDNYAQYNFREFEMFYNCLSKLTIV